MHNNHNQTKYSISHYHGNQNFTIQLLNMEWAEVIAGHQNRLASFPGLPPLYPLAPRPVTQKAGVSLGTRLIMDFIHLKVQLGGVS